MEEIQQVIEDLKNDFYPSDDKFYEKIKCDGLKPGQRIHWYYKDDLDFFNEWIADDEDNSISVRDEAPFSGIVVPYPNIEMNSDLETEHCIVVVTTYPVEKCYCESGWISLHRLLDRDDLVEIF